MKTPMLTWRVVGWDARFETRGSLRKRGPRAGITVSTDLEGEELRRLLDASGGFLAFGVWNLVCRIAATCARRGVLVNDGVPMSDADLARLARFPVNLISPALQLLASPEIGLLERVPLDQALVPAEVPEPLPRKPRIQPLLQCPVCNADLTEYYQLETRMDESTNESVAGEHVSARDVMETRAEEAERSRIRENSEAELQGVRILTNSATERGQTDERGDDHKPRPTWVKPATYSRATKAEIEDVKRRFQSGEMTEAELCHFIETHYYDEDEDDDDWDEEDDDWEDEEFQTDIPPPKIREWG